MKQLLIVFLGGGAGSVVRYLISKLYSQNPVFPYGTLTSNFISCIIFGAVIMWGTQKLHLNPLLKLLLLTGFCGGFSTFSSFTFETIELFKNGNTGLAMLNVLLNLSLSISGLFIGMMTFKLL